MTAILGRMASYSGQQILWDDALKSTLELGPSTLTWDTLPQSRPGPDGLYPCPLPGVTKAV